MTDEDKNSLIKLVASSELWDRVKNTIMSLPTDQGDGKPDIPDGFYDLFPELRKLTELDSGFENEESDDDENDNIRYIVGMDLHCEKVQLCITKWVGCDEDKSARRDICTTVEDACNTYRKNIPHHSVTVIEASTGSFAMAKKLMTLGYMVKVVTSDAVNGYERADHINDKIDAHNLACAEAANRTKSVHIPDIEHMGYRVIYSKYKVLVKDCTRISNRFWNYCSARAYTLPPRCTKRKIATMTSLLEQANKDSVDYFLLKTDMEDYKRKCESIAEIKRSMAKIIIGNEQMLKAMMLPGIGPISAFAIVAYVEDFTRFKSSAALVSYLGLCPICNQSGKSKGSNHTTNYGLRNIKSDIIKGMQTAVKHGEGPAFDWANAILATKGKPRNVVIVALARKIVTYLWHLMVNHPVQSRENENMYRHKLIKICEQVGKEYLHETYHYVDKYAFAKDKTEMIFGHLPHLSEKKMKKTAHAKETNKPTKKRTSSATETVAQTPSRACAKQGKPKRTKTSRRAQEAELTLSKPSGAA